MKHKEKYLKALVRNMLKLDIHHPERVNSLNRQINHAAIRDLQFLPEESKIAYQKLISLTDEISILAETAIKNNTLARMRLSMQFSKKQEELENLYHTLFKK